MRLVLPVAVAWIVFGPLAGSASAGASPGPDGGTTRSTARYVCAQASCPPFAEVDPPCYERAQTRSQSGRAATDWLVYNHCMAASGWTLPRLIDLDTGGAEPDGADDGPPPVGAALGTGASEREAVPRAVVERRTRRYRKQGAQELPQVRQALERGEYDLVARFLRTYAGVASPELSALRHDLEAKTREDGSGEPSREPDPATR